MSCKGQIERTIGILEQPYHFLVPPLTRDGSEVPAPHPRMWLAADPLASSASEGGREVMIRDTLK